MKLFKWRKYCAVQPQQISIDRVFHHYAGGKARWFSLSGRPKGFAGKLPVLLERKEDRLGLQLLNRG